MKWENRLFCKTVCFFLVQKNDRPTIKTFKNCELLVLYFPIDITQHHLNNDRKKRLQCQKTNSY